MTPVTPWEKDARFGKAAAVFAALHLAATALALIVLLWPFAHDGDCFHGNAATRTADFVSYALSLPLVALAENFVALDIVNRFPQFLAFAALSVLNSALAGAAGAWVWTRMAKTGFTRYTPGQ